MPGILDFVDGALDIKRENEIAKHEQMRKYLWIVAAVIIVALMSGKKRKY